MTTAGAMIHPSASVDPSAVIGDGVVIEQGAIVGPGCEIGAGTRLRMRSIVVQDTVMGEQNDVHAQAVLGGDPQDTSFDASVDSGRLVIGDKNVFRENVTLNRGCGEAGATRIGSGCMFMAQAHAGHNAVVGDNVILANGVNLAGHAHVAGGCFFSALSSAHQFVDVGELVMMRAWAGSTKHVPPFCIVRSLNVLGGINVVGMRRSGRFCSEEIDEVREVYRTVLRVGHRETGSLGESIEKALEGEWSHGAKHLLEWVAAHLDIEGQRGRGVLTG